MLGVEPNEEKRIVDKDTVRPPAVPSDFGINSELITVFIAKLLRVHVRDVLKPLRL